MKAIINKETCIRFGISPDDTAEVIINTVPDELVANVLGAAIQYPVQALSIQ